MSQSFKISQQQNESFEQNNASIMLENALQQFDNMIGDSSNFYTVNGDETEEFKNGAEGIGQLIEDLRVTIEAEKYSSNLTERELLKHVSSKTVQFYQNLFLSNSPKPAESDEISRLKIENESLQLHTNVLNDQVDLQTEKIKELETTLTIMKDGLMKSDEKVQKELLLRTELETVKLRLMEEISSLKIESLQKSQMGQKEANLAIDEEIKELKQHSFEMGRQCKDLEDKNEMFKMQILDLEENLKMKEQECELFRKKSDVFLNGMKLAESNSTHKHMLQLKMPQPTATSTPISTGDADRLSSPSTTISSKTSPTVTPTSTKGFVHLTSPTPYTHREQQEVRAVSLERLHQHKITTLDSTESTPVKRSSSHDHNLDQTNAKDLGRDTMGGSTDLTSKPVQLTSSPPIKGKAKKSKSNSTPNLAMTNICNANIPEVSPAQAPTVQHTTEEEEVGMEDNHFQHRKKHGFKKFFSSFRLRRSKSGNLENDDIATSSHAKPSKQYDNNSSFKRGGVRATAGPRIGWNRDVPQNVSTISSNESGPFGHWDTSRVCDWMTQIGLGMYVPNCKQWVTRGSVLLQATTYDLEKELGIRNVLHKKKLMLAIQALGTEEEEMRVGKSGMHIEWIPRWLDDVGLPQYKSTFQQALIDGNMLHHLTMADLQRLQVTNLLHMLSLRRGIQMLRKIEFDPTKLNRRPLENRENEVVSTWTNHRVMEWLRMADLAEYVPNLRGSGVHGALIVLEPLFTSDCLANLLQIPPSKTLIRRHLSSKYDELLTKEAREIKQKHAGILSISSKMKIGKRSFGALSRLRGSSNPIHREFSSGEYVCPIETKNSGGKNTSMAAHRTALESKMQLQEMKNKRIEEEEDLTDDKEGGTSENGSIEVVELNERTAKEIGAFSEELKTLTSKLGQS